ncbi:putative transferase [[Enterobacter] lignolyticus SCF1]|uniref:Transferase n=1 Tax=Enterobacter lignolyticus (strain SCF1) TaxID=701347 RepID=E3G6E9_ENTLS|nr:putative transferase [[Enterobacter] lignolyticus SCF1]
MSIGAVIDEKNGPVLIGHGSRICHGVVLEGPVVIGSNCLIGNYTFIRAGTFLGNDVRTGFAAEIKGSVIEDGVRIGPQCFIADSVLEPRVYLGAQVRTSNHRLDGRTISVHVGNQIIDSGREKLGCLIGADSALGVQVIILPGRIIQPGTRLAPRITVERNLPVGDYRLRQELINVERKS